MITVTATPVTTNHLTRPAATWRRVWPSAAGPWPPGTGAESTKPSTTTGGAQQQAG